MMLLKIWNELNVNSPWNLEKKALELKNAENAQYFAFLNLQKHRHKIDMQQKYSYYYPVRFMCKGLMNLYGMY
jgi:predicted transcriptional regulator